MFNTLLECQFFSNVMVQSKVDNCGIDLIMQLL